MVVLIAAKAANAASLALLRRFVAALVLLVELPARLLVLFPIILLASRRTVPHFALPTLRGRCLLAERADFVLRGRAIPVPWPQRSTFCIRRRHKYPIHRVGRQMTQTYVDSKSEIPLCC